MTLSTEIKGGGAFGHHPALLPRPGQARELCQLVSDWTGRIAAGGCIVEPKLDGIRALWLGAELVTREGTPIAGAEHIEAELMRLQHEAAVPLFVDGEWVVGDSFAATLTHFQARGRSGDAGTLHVFDVMPLSVWRGEDPCEALEVRRGKVDRLLGGTDSLHIRAQSVRPMPWAWMTCPMEIERHARDYIAQGGEGIVVKHGLSTYQRKRSSAWQRIKRATTLDLEIVRAEPMKAKPWLLGCLVVDHRGKEVRVTAGFSDAERLSLMRRRDDLPGLIAEVECMEVTEKGSLRSPRWVRMREDKGTRDGGIW